MISFNLLKGLLQYLVNKLTKAVITYTNINANQLRIENGSA